MPGDPWRNFGKDSLEIDLEKHSKPTCLFILNAEADGLPAPPPFTDITQIWRAAFAIRVEHGPVIASFLERHQTVDLLDAAEALFESILQPEKWNQDNATGKDSPRYIVLQLARTPPNIFGSSFQNSQDPSAKAVLKLDIYEGSEELPCVRRRRYDMVFWVAAYNVLGNAWSYLSARPVGVDVDPNQVVLEIYDGNGQTMTVSHETKAAMATAIESNLNPPKIFVRCRDVIKAVAKVLQVNYLEYSMPFSEEEMNSFDWKAVEPGNKDTYPTAREPTSNEFALVRTVHEAVRKEKEAQRDHTGSIQGYGTYKLRWKQWRDILAVYRFMNPTEDLLLVEAIVMGELKLCTSIKIIDNVTKTAVAKHLTKLVNQQQKKARLERLEQSKAVAAQEMAVAKAAAALAAEQQTRLERERSEIAEQLERSKAAAALQAMAAPTAAAEAQQAQIETEQSESAKHLEAVQLQASLEKKQQQENAAKRREADAVKLAAEKEKEQAELTKEQEKVSAEESKEPERKRSKRYDVVCLTEQLTPRARAESDDSWKPPMRTLVRGRNVWEPPGSTWEADSSQKLSHLYTLHKALKDKNFLQSTMTLYLVMDCIGPEANKLDFQQKVFLYLIALLLQQGSGRYVHCLSLPVYFVSEANPCALL